MTPLLLLAFLSASAPSAPTPQASDPCPDGRITSVLIDNRSVFDVDAAEIGVLRWGYRVANALHVRTRESVIGRELLFSEGDCYEPALLRDSERLLRELDFLASVEIEAERDPEGGYRIRVATRDEWSTQIDLGAEWDDGFEFRGARLREKNLLGTGRSLRLHYIRRDLTHDYGASFGTPQLFGSRWNLAASAGRTSAGTFLGESLTYPFLAEVGRWAARQTAVHRDEYFGYVVDRGSESEMHVLLPVQDRALTASVVHRIGSRGDMITYGGALAMHRLAYPGGPDAIRVSTGGRELVAGSADLAGQVLTQAHPIQTVRALGLIGKRNIEWIQRRGFDALQGQQDLRVGTELTLVVGAALPGLSPARDVVASGTAFGATLVRDVLVSAWSGVDARRALDGSSWRDILAQGEALAYWKPAGAPNHTAVLRVAATGGWHTIRPFQLTLGGSDAVRGYDDDRLPGGRRVVFTVEDRYYFGKVRDALDLGASVFLDVGRVWPGDAPFGMDSGWRGTVGVGLRGAAPPGSRTTYRIDLAAPIGPGASWRDARILISTSEVLGLVTGTGHPELSRSRRAGHPANLFSFTD